MAHFPPSKYRAWNGDPTDPPVTELSTKLKDAIDSASYKRLYELNMGNAINQGCETCGGPCKVAIGKKKAVLGTFYLNVRIQVINASSRAD
jgi:hypothetical protein